MLEKLHMQTNDTTNIHRTRCCNATSYVGGIDDSLNGNRSLNLS